MSRNIIIILIYQQHKLLDINTSGNVTYRYATIQIHCGPVSVALRVSCIKTEHSPLSDMF